VARNGSDADLVGPDAERLPPFEEVVRLVRLRILVPRIVVSAELSQPWQLAAAAVYWRSCGTGHGGQCADVVDVTVRDKHCDRFELPLLDHLEDAGGFGARVYDQARRLVRAAHQVAIRLERADGELEGSGDDRRLLGCVKWGEKAANSGLERASLATVEAAGP
jgi:hypothetical protein